MLALVLRTKVEAWVVALVWNSIRSGTDLIILDSKDLTEKAILEVPISIPHGLHGSWVEN